MAKLSFVMLIIGLFVTVSQGKAFDKVSIPFGENTQSKPADQQECCMGIPIQYSRAVKGDGWGVRTNYINRLNPLQGIPTISELVSLDEHSRGIALLKLLELDAESAGKIVHALIVALADKSWKIRMRAADSLRNVKKSSPQEIAPQLIRTLVMDPVWAVRFHAATALGWIGENGIYAVPALMLALKDEEPKVRAASFIALGDIYRSHVYYGGSRDAKVISALIQSVGDRQITKLAFSTLGQVSDDPKIITALLEATKDKDPEIREAARCGLDSMGYPDKVYLPSAGSTGLFLPPEVWTYSSLQNTFALRVMQLFGLDEP